ncbi:MAG: hypothetical protein AB2745_20790 [Candidatus Thiodiazotropha endolucinida]
MSGKKLKGGRKGGSSFPRVELKQAVEYAKKLVSKTHTGPQPQKVIYPGVFGVTSSRGGPKASALKQYKLMKGTPQAYEATELAKNISVSPHDEVSSLLVESLLSVSLFKTAFDTFKGDTVSEAKIKQQAASNNIHPDSLDEFLSIFVDSCVYAGLASKEADGISFVLDTHIQQIERQVEDEQDEGEDEPQDDSSLSDNEELADSDTDNLDEGEPQDESQSNWERTKQKADIQIKIDPSMDPEKLDKLLGVLKKYGQL